MEIFCFEKRAALKYDITSLKNNSMTRIMIKKKVTQLQFTHKLINLLNEVLEMSTFFFS
jgi:hypothetical protein